MEEFWEKQGEPGIIEINGKNQIRVCRVVKGGKELIDIRKFYLKGGEWHYAKGISIPTEIGELVLQSLSAVLAQQSFFSKNN